MAQVPRYFASGKAATHIAPPTVDPQTAAMPYAQLERTAGRIGESVTNMLLSVQRGRDAAAFADADNRITARMIELENGFEDDPDFDTMQDRWNQQVDSFASELIDQAPATARTAIGQRLQQVRLQYGQRMHNLAKEKELDYGRATVNEAVRQTIDTVAGGYLTADQAREKLTAYIAKAADSGYLTDEQSLALTDQAANGIYDAENKMLGDLFEKYVRQVAAEQGPDAAMDMLMDPKKVQDLADTFGLDSQTIDARAEDIRKQVAYEKNRDEARTRQHRESQLGELYTSMHKGLIENVNAYVEANLTAFSEDEQEQYKQAVWAHATANEKSDYVADHPETFAKMQFRISQDAQNVSTSELQSLVGKKNGLSSKEYLDLAAMKKAAEPDDGFMNRLAFKNTFHSLEQLRNGLWLADKDGLTPDQMVLAEDTYRRMSNEWFKWGQNHPDATDAEVEAAFGEKTAPLFTDFGIGKFTRAIDLAKTERANQRKAVEQYLTQLSAGKVSATEGEALIRTLPKWQQNAWEKAKKEGATVDEFLQYIRSKQR